MPNTIVIWPTYIFAGNIRHFPHAQHQRRNEEGECLPHSIEIKNRVVSVRDRDPISCSERIFGQV